MYNRFSLAQVSLHPRRTREKPIASNQIAARPNYAYLANGVLQITRMHRAASAAAVVRSGVTDQHRSASARAEGRRAAASFPRGRAVTVPFALPVQHASRDPFSFFCALALRVSRGEEQLFYARS